MVIIFEEMQKDIRAIEQSFLKIVHRLDKLEEQAGHVDHLRRRVEQLEQSRNETTAAIGKIRRRIGMQETAPEPDPFAGANLMAEERLREIAAVFRDVTREEWDAFDKALVEVRRPAPELPEELSEEQVERTCELMFSDYTRGQKSMGLALSDLARAWYAAIRKALKGG